MDAMSIQTHLHSLNDKWDLYYHLPHDKNWNLESYVPIKNDIDNVETNSQTKDSSGVDTSTGRKVVRRSSAK